MVEKSNFLTKIHWDEKPNFWSKNLIFFDKNPWGSKT